MSTAPTYIGLLDCNNFFVSCERLFRPDLVGKPVVVLSANDGCIIARSAEVKALGIPMGMPYFKVHAELARANAAVFSSNFQLYRDISARVMQVLAAHTDAHEVYSIDEAFFILEGNNPLAEARALQAVVEQWVGVPVSIGVGKSKTIAKYASEYAKQHDGIYGVLDDTQWRRTAKDIPAAALWGVGRKVTERFARHDLATVLDIMDAPRQFLHSIAGVHGERLHDELTGIAPRKLSAVPPLQKSIMSSRSFGAVTNDRSVIDDAVAYHIAHAAEKMRMLGCAARSLSVSLYPRRYGSFQSAGGTRDVLLTKPSSDTRVLLQQAIHLINGLYDRDVHYGKVGITLSGFVPHAQMTGSLFEQDATSTTSDTLMKTLDVLNARYGNNTVRPATLRREHVWEPRAQHRSARYTTSWSELPRAK